MSVEGFIKDRLVCLVERFPKTKIRYAFDGATGDHVIEVSPSNIYEDSSFSEFESNLIVQFINEFNNESIVFISPDENCFDMDPVIWQVTGNNFDIYTSDSVYTWLDYPAGKIPKPVSGERAGENNYALAA